VKYFFKNVSIGEVTGKKDACFTCSVRLGGVFEDEEFAIDFTVYIPVWHVETAVNC